MCIFIRMGKFPTFADLEQNGVSTVWVPSSP
jgi:hypothetical protein